MHIAFIAQNDGKNSLWLRSLDKLEATAVRGTDDAYFPFWSPDGTAVAFFMQGKLWRTDLNGASPSAICDGHKITGKFSRPLTENGGEAWKGWWTWSGSNRRPLPCHGSGKRLSY
jgi:Tol biopolymer transport system component